METSLYNLSSSQQRSNHPQDDQALILTQLRKFEEEAYFYRKRYYETKSINQSIIAAIKLVYSQEVGEELERIVQEEEKGFSASRANINYSDLTNNICQKMKTYGSKFVSEQSAEQLPFRVLTPKKNENSVSGSFIKNTLKVNISPLLGKSNIKDQSISSSFIKGECCQPSTRRSYTPVRSRIATQIYCQLCQKVFPPNQFVNHAQKCKYELEYIESEDRRSSRICQSKAIEINYDKMMRNLLKIREEIQQQIYMITASKQEIDRASLKKKLQKDLKKVVKVIKQKEEEMKKKKGDTCKTSSVKGVLSKKCSKVR